MPSGERGSGVNSGRERSKSRKKNDAAGITAARTEKARPFSRGQLLFGCRLSLESGPGGGGTENEGSR